MIHNAVIVSANGMKCCILKKFSDLISDAMMPLQNQPEGYNCTRRQAYYSPTCMYGSSHLSAMHADLKVVLWDSLVVLTS